MKNKNVVIGVIIVVLVVLGALVFENKRESGQTEDFVVRPAEFSGELIKGRKAPEITFHDFKGQAYSLSDFEGKGVVLDFWAGWCPFCIQEMPELQKAQDEYAGELVIIGIHRTDTEEVSTGLEFARERDVNYLLVSDADGTLYEAAGGFGMPVAVFIDANGVVQDIKSGPKTTDEIKEKISELLNN